MARRRVVFNGADVNVKTQTVAEPVTDSARPDVDDLDIQHVDNEKRVSFWDRRNRPLPFQFRYNYFSGK